MAVELGRTWCVRHGHPRFARLFRQQRGAAMLNRDARARRQAPPRATLRRSLGLRGGKCAGRRLDSTTKEEGDWPSTGGKETD